MSVEPIIYAPKSSTGRSNPSRLF